MPAFGSGIGLPFQRGWGISGGGGNQPPLRSYIRSWLIGTNDDGTIDDKLTIVTPEPIRTGSNCLLFSGGAGEVSLPTISFGETMAELVGTASVTSILGQTLLFGNGTLFSLLLSNGDHLIASTGIGTTLYNISNPFAPSEGEVFAEAQLIGDNL